MIRTLVLTLIGDDRPGMVDRLAAVIAAHGGNWLESRMARLAGKFAGILRAEIPGDRADALRAALADLAGDGIRVTVEDCTPTDAADSGRAAVLDIVGQDRPGIVSQISHALAAHGANVEDFHSECTSAPMSAESLFRARIHLLLPDGLDLAALRAEIETIAADLMIDARIGA